MNWSDYEDRLNAAVMTHLSESILIHPNDTPMALPALVDIEGVNCETVGGSVAGVIGKAEISSLDASHVQKGDIILYAGTRYQVVAHPRQLEAKMTELELGKINEHRTEIHNIRY